MSKMIETLHRSHRGHRVPRHAISRHARTRQPAIARAAAPQGLKLQSEVAEALSNQIVPPKRELGPQVRPLPQFLKLDHQTLATYRGLFRRIGDSLDLSQSRSICITSAAASEGKTTTVLSLAFVAAQQAERRVLVIDANFVRPQVADRLGFQQRLGLFDALQDGVFPAEAIRESLPVGYDVLPAGQFDNRAADLLCGRRMGVLLWDLKQSYDLIIVDAPHVRDESVARMFAQYFDAVFLAVKMLETRREIIDSAISLLHRAGAAVQGCILTQQGAVQELESAIAEIELATARAAEPQDDGMVYAKPFETLAATSRQLQPSSRANDDQPAQVANRTPASTAEQPTPNASTPTQSAPTQPDTKTADGHDEQIPSQSVQQESPQDPAAKTANQADIELPLSIVWNHVAPVDSDSLTWAAAIPDLSLTISALGNTEEEFGITGGTTNPLIPEVNHVPFDLVSDSTGSACSEENGDCSDGYVWVADKTDLAGDSECAGDEFADHYDKFSSETASDVFPDPTETQFETIVDQSYEPDMDFQSNDSFCDSDFEPADDNYSVDSTEVSTYGLGFGPVAFENGTMQVQSDDAAAEFCLLVNSHGAAAESESFEASESSAVFTDPSPFNSQFAAWPDAADEPGDEGNELHNSFAFGNNRRERHSGQREGDTLRKLETIRPFEAAGSPDLNDESEPGEPDELLSELTSPLEASIFAGPPDGQNGLATVSSSGIGSGELDRETSRRIQVHRPTLMSLQSAEHGLNAIGVRETKQSGAKESWAANVLAVCGGLLILAGIFYVAVDVAIWF